MTTDEDPPVSADQPPQDPPLSAEEIVRLVATRAEWVDFYDGQYPSVVRFVMRFAEHPEDARDAAGEAFAESWDLATSQPDSWAQIKHKPAWIREVARRKYVRPPGPRIRPLIDGHAEIPDRPDPQLEPGELTAQTQLVLHALRSLDEEQQAVMAYRMDDFPDAVIAETLGITEDRVRYVARKARAALKRNLYPAGTPERRDPR